MPVPSARNCRSCASYNRGTGGKACLRCQNYLQMSHEDTRRSINIIPMVSTVIESVPAPSMPDNLLLALIWSLRAQDAAMISMHYYGALSCREIAQVTGVSEATARKRLYRSVSQLAKKMSQQYPELKCSLDAKMSLLLSPIYI